MIRLSIHLFCHVLKCRTGQQMGEGHMVMHCRLLDADPCWVEL